MGKLSTFQNQLTLFPEGSPVKISALQDPERGCQVSAAVSGLSFLELSLKSDRVGQSLRMSLGLELSELTGCSLTWREQTTPLGRWWWVLSMPELRTEDSECGLLPTIKASDGRPKGDGGNRKSPGLDQLAKAGLLPTPTAKSYGRNKGGANPDGKIRPSLETLTGQKRLSPCFVEWMMGYPAEWTDVSD